MKHFSFLPSILALALCSLFLTTGCHDNPVGDEPCRSAVLTAGLDDNFAPGNSEPASPSPELLAHMTQNYYNPYLLHQFDQMDADRPVGHTFQLPGVDATHRAKVKRAVLTFRVKGLGSALQNDWFHLIVNDGNGGITGAFDASFVYLNGGSWKTGDQMLVTLDLANLPLSESAPASPTNILDRMWDGKLHVYLQDDTAVDFMKLEVEYCTECGCDGDPSRDV